MGIYDAERDLVCEAPKYFSHCAGCGKVMLKKQMVTIGSKRRYGNIHTIGHLCEACYVEFLERYEWSEKQDV